MCFLLGQLFCVVIQEALSKRSLNLFSTGHVKTIHDVDQPPICRFQGLGSPVSLQGVEHIHFNLRPVPSVVQPIRIHLGPLGNRIMFFDWILPGSRILTEQDIKGDFG